MWFVCFKRTFKQAWKCIFTLEFNHSMCWAQGLTPCTVPIGRASCFEADVQLHLRHRKTSSNSYLPRNAAIAVEMTKHSSRRDKRVFLIILLSMRYIWTEFVEEWNSYTCLNLGAKKTTETSRLIPLGLYNKLSLQCKLLFSFACYCYNWPFLANPWTAIPTSVSMNHVVCDFMSLFRSKL